MHTLKKFAFEYFRPLIILYNLIQLHIPCNTFLPHKYIHAHTVSGWICITIVSFLSNTLLPGGITPPTLSQDTLGANVLEILQVRVTVAHSVATVTLESPCVIWGLPAKCKNAKSFTVCETWSETSYLTPGMCFFIHEKNYSGAFC